eukprot:SAG31_NODE_198_length_20656_cov_5.167291_4_plen_107_part_00
MKIPVPKWSGNPSGYMYMREWISKFSTSPDGQTGRLNLNLVTVLDSGQLYRAVPKFSRGTGTSVPTATTCSKFSTGTRSKFKFSTAVDLRVQIQIYLWRCRGETDE